MKLCDQCNKPLRPGSIDRSDQWVGVVRRHKKCHNKLAEKQAIKRAKENAKAWIELTMLKPFPKGAGAVTRGVK